MRVWTPAEAGQVPPNGIPLIYGGGGSVGSFNQNVPVTADIVLDSDAFFNPTTNGLYRVSLFAETAAATGGACSLGIDVTQVGGVGAFITQVLSLNTLGDTVSQTVDLVLLAADGPVTIERSISGFVAPNGSYYITVKAYLLA